MDATAIVAVVGIGTTHVGTLFAPIISQCYGGRQRDKREVRRETRLLSEELLGVHARLFAMRDTEWDQPPERRILEIPVPEWDRYRTVLAASPQRGLWETISNAYFSVETLPDAAGYGRESRRPSFAPWRHRCSRGRCQQRFA